MTLSEALRLGSMTTKQIYFSYYGCGPGGQIIGTCAIGAIRLALGRLNLRDQVPELMARLNGDCPACQAPSTDVLLAEMLMHLNDHHQWTREQIADWLEQWEEGNAERSMSSPEGERFAPVRTES